MQITSSAAIIRAVVAAKKVTCLASKSQVCSQACRRKRTCCQDHDGCGSMPMRVHVECSGDILTGASTAAQHGCCCIHSCMQQWSHPPRSVHTCGKPPSIRSALSSRVCADCAASLRSCACSSSSRPCTQGAADLSTAGLGRTLTAAVTNSSSFLRTEAALSICEEATGQPSQQRSRNPCQHGDVSMRPLSYIL